MLVTLCPVWSKRHGSSVLEHIHVGTHFIDGFGWLTIQRLTVSVAAFGIACDGAQNGSAAHEHESNGPEHYTDQSAVSLIRKKNSII